MMEGGRIQLSNRIPELGQPVLYWQCKGDEPFFGVADLSSPILICRRRSRGEGAKSVGLAQNGNSQFPIEDRLLAGKLLSLNGFFHANDGVCND